MMTNISCQSDADRVVAELEDARNRIITAMIGARSDDADGEHWYASLKTECVYGPLRVVENHEALLIEWAAHKTDDHDHDAECAYEDMAEDQYQARKDNAA